MLTILLIALALGAAAPSCPQQLETISLPEFLDGRRVWVCLPAGYHDQTRLRYPVLYMLDGQNLFDAAASFAGEWRVDETLADLTAQGRVAPLIVVGVDNGGPQRLAEYTPWPDARHGGGAGREHLQQIITVLMPAINARYRTLTGPQHTGLAGSSLGGLMALYAAFAHPDVFGRVGAFSPSLWWAGEMMTSLAARQPKPPVRLYLDMGTRENRLLQDGDGNGRDDAVDRLERLRAVLLRLGFVPGEDLLTVVAEGAIHNEAAWAARFPGAARFLFPDGE